MSTIANVRRDHQLETHSSNTGGVISNTAKCACGRPIPWRDRQTIFEAHLFEEVYKAGQKNPDLAGQEFQLVSSPCDCEDSGCYGKCDFKLFVSEQTARQEALKRTKRYFGHKDRPDMHIDRIKISTKTSDY